MGIMTAIDAEEDKAESHAWTRMSVCGGAGNIGRFVVPATLNPRLRVHVRQIQHWRCILPNAYMHIRNLKLGRTLLS